MSAVKSKTIALSKWSATGNDFVILDLRERDNCWIKPGLLPSMAKRLSTEFASDGLIALSAYQLKVRNPTPGVRIRFFNPDGTRAFCGNGTRASGFYELRHVLKKTGGIVAVATDAGTIAVRVNGEEGVLTDVALPNIATLRPAKISSFPSPIYEVWSGSPHAVLFVTDVNNYDVDKTGRALRHHASFKPLGTNVDFVEVVSPGSLRVRTYERGVERETKSCGSGVMASVHMARVLGKVKGDRVQIQTPGGEFLVRFNGPKLDLAGKIRQLFQGIAYLGFFIVVCEFLFLSHRSALIAHCFLC